MGQGWEEPDEEEEGQVGQCGLGGSGVEDGLDH